MTFPRVKDFFRAHLNEDVDPFMHKAWMEGVEEAVSGRRSSLSLLVFADLQPIAQAAGPSQFEACQRLFDEIRESFPGADGAIIAGDIGHRGGVDAGQIAALIAAGFPGAENLKPGDPYPLGAAVVLSEFVARTGIPLARVLTIPGNHDVSARGNGKNPTAWTYSHYRDDLGSPYYWAAFGNVAFLCLGTQGGWITGQISAEVIAWAERVLASNQSLHWHLVIHHPPVGYGPTEPDMTWLPEVAITSGHVSAYAASGSLTLDIGAHNYQSMQKTPVYLDGRMLLVGRDYEYYAPPPEAEEGEATGPEDVQAPEGAPPGYGEHTQITLLPTLAPTLAAGQQLRAGVVANVEGRQDAWTTHMLVGTPEEPGLLRKFAPQGHDGPGRIRLCLWGHTGTIHDPAQRHSWIDAETGVRFAGLNMALNAQVAAGLGAEAPLVYAVANWSRATNSLSFQYRNATAEIRPDGSFSGAPLQETHGLSLDFTLTYPTPLDLGDGGLTRDGRTLDGGHQTFLSTFWQGDIADMESRRKPTGAVDPVTGFPLNDKAAPGFLRVGVFDLTDKSLSDSKAGDGFGWHVNMPSGRSSSLGGYVPWVGDPSQHVMTFGFERSRDAEALPHAVAFWRAKVLSGEWKDILRLNGETGLAEMPSGVWAMGGFDLVTENLSRANEAASPQTVSRLFWRERAGNDVGEGEGVRQTYGVKLEGDAAPRELFAFETRKINAVDSDPRHTFSLEASPDGIAEEETVFLVDPVANRVEFGWPVDLPAGSVLPGYPTEANLDSLAGRVEDLEAETEAGAADLAALADAARSGALRPLLDAPLAQRHLGELGLGAVTTSGNTEVFPGAGRSPQGFCHVQTPSGGRYFALIRASGTGWTPAETFRIVEYVCNADLTLGARLAVSQEIFLGHQPLSGLWRAGGVDLFAAIQTMAGDDRLNAGKGLSRIRWRGAATDQSDVTNIRLWGLQGSGHRFDRFRDGVPVVSKDGSRLVVSAFRAWLDGEWQDYSEQILSYNLAEVEALAAAHAGDATAATVRGVISPPYPPTASGRILQALAVQGDLLARQVGYVNPRGQQYIQIISLSTGDVLRTIELEGARGLYAHEALFGSAETGVPSISEFEGLDFVGGESLVCLVADDWRMPAEIVTRGGRNWAAVQASTGVDPLALSGSWTETLLPASHGAWASGAAYAGPTGYEARRKQVFAVEAAGAHPAQQALQQGKSYPPPRASMASAGNTVSVSVPVGENYAIAAFDGSLDAYRRLLVLASGNRALFYDSRQDSDPTRPGSVVVERGGRSLVGLRATESLATGAGVTLHAADDPTLPGAVRLSAHRTVSGAPQNLAADLLGDGKFVPGGSHSDQAIGRADRRWPVGYFGRVDVSDAAATRANLGAASAADVTDLQVALAAALLRIEALET